MWQVSPTAVYNEHAIAQIPFWEDESSIKGNNLVGLALVRAKVKGDLPPGVRYLIDPGSEGQSCDSGVRR